MTTCSYMKILDTGSKARDKGFEKPWLVVSLSCVGGLFLALGTVHAAWSTLLVRRLCRHAIGSLFKGY